MIKIKVNQIKMNIKHSIDDVVKEALKKAHTQKNNLVSYKIIKKSIDARKSPIYIYAVQLELNKYNLKKLPKDVSIVKKEEKYIYNVTGNKKLEKPPVVVGFGPAGMFCGYLLAKAGYNPIIIERGKDVDSRIIDVEEFWKTGKLNTESNVQFGEGGAGTFSDGKLNTGIKDKNGRQNFVLETFVKCGASENIMYDSKPHIGTDILQIVVKNLRKEIESLGGKIFFESKLTNIEKEGNFYNLEINNSEKIQSQICILAIGHSARDTFEMLYNKSFPMEQKPFAIGVRVEHLQDMINKSQYGVDDCEGLPAAPYKLTYNTKNKRGVYSFCMCPGGCVVNASSEDKRLAVNGMSYSARDGKNANSAIVTTITPNDFESKHPLAGMYLQRELEEKAFNEGNGAIPVQLYGDFVNNKISHEFRNVIPDIKGKYSFANIKNVLPKYICDSIEEAMPYFGKKIQGFDNKDTVFAAIESRTSSPVRIIREDDFQSVFKGIYPCGEGAGYAGGITSAAIDGIKVFESIISEFRP